MTARPIDRFWAAFLGVDETKLEEPGLSVVPHRRFGDWEGVWVYVRGSACIVMAPPRWLDRIRGALAPVPLAERHSRELLASLFGPELDRFIGPAWHGWLEPDAFRPVDAAAVRAIAPGDAAAIETLRAAVDPDEWDMVNLDAETAFGWFEDGDLLAAASDHDWTGDGPIRAVNPAVITHPAHRGRGRGAAVVSRVAARARAEGVLPVYQTLVANAGARAVARRLGYEEYARHLAVRLQRS